ncbi:prepilin-type N-terminal cleavage/methylation domain-containing protein [Patescibacteria group bacterium]|nr:prepilin-type N-terminal cleavage/methylation domain-containing protein [Patescibacteria group bacterium]
MRKGFTLVELLVVIAIIGLLTGMIVISIKTVKAKARDSQRVSDVNTIATALNLYHNDSNNYPIFDGYITGSDALSSVLISVGTASGIPIDPLNAGDYRYYYQSTDGSDYYLEYYLETNSVLGKSEGLNYIVP